MAFLGKTKAPKIQMSTIMTLLDQLWGAVGSLQLVHSGLNGLYILFDLATLLYVTPWMVPPEKFAPGHWAI